MTDSTGAQNRGSDDSFDLLRALNPVPDTRALELPPTTLVDEIISGTRSVRRSRHIRVIGPAVVVAGALVLAAATYVATRDPSHTTEVGCYDAANLHANTVVIRTDGEDPAAACAELWNQGEVGTGPTPPLQACVLDSGAVAVMPGVSDSTCSRLGLPALAPDTGPPQRSSRAPDVLGLRDALASHSEPCMTPTNARRIAREELQRHGLGTWTVAPTATELSRAASPDRPCATFAIDEPNRIVLIVASLPRPPSPSDQ